MLTPTLLWAVLPPASTLVLGLLALTLLLLGRLREGKACVGPWPPGPRPWPLYGSLHLLAGEGGPWEAFRRLRERYGDVLRIRLGAKECVVVSSLEAIREVLLTKPKAFSSRPNFLRYHALFGGNRNNSLALCDWSKLQAARRDIASPYVFPRNAEQEALEAAIISELDAYLSTVSHAADQAPSTAGVAFDKAHFSAVCANVFYAYLCSRRYSYEDSYFRRMVKAYDDIFHDINNGFALDFLPWLLPFKALHLMKLFLCGRFIRRFLTKTLIESRVQGPIDHEHPRDFLDVLLAGGRSGRRGVRLSRDDALYELEDLLGGHSAVACLWTRLLAQIVRRPDVKLRIRQEVLEVVGPEGEPRLAHRSRMPYVQAVVWETLRVTTSPIVPHVAAEDAEIGGFRVSKGSMIFLNNYYLNLSEDYWNEPQNFDPDRFFVKNGKVLKPKHFLPFSLGPRSCLGYQLLNSIIFLTTVKLFQRFEVEPECGPTGPQTLAGPTIVTGPTGPTLTVPVPITRKISRDVECAKLSVYDSDVRVLIRPLRPAPKSLSPASLTP